MSLANGRQYLAIPGPSVMPDRVLQAMHRPAPNIYTGALIDMTATIVADLKRVARTAHDVAIYIANGHGVWEAALCNTMSRGDRVLVLGTGRFAQGWGETARGLGIATDVIDFGYRSAVDLDRVAAALRADTGHRIKAVLAVQVDTASSVRNDIHGLRRVLDETGHPALLFSDNIACLAVDEFHMDDWGVDLMVTGSQKGLMVPPGLGFVFFGPKAAAARENADLVTPYWDWRPRAAPERYYQHFGGTAPTHHLFGLREALDMILQEEGLEAVWHRHAVLARAIWAAVEAWGAGTGIALNIADPGARSHAVTTVRLPGDAGTRLRGWLEDQAGITLGIPLGAPEDEAPGVFRIGHMGHVNTHMVLGVLGAIEAGMLALEVPHAPGGLEAAAKAIARG
ncbi:aminotransferase class V-fold PLP-dependent enzyme [Rhodobacteraceae bacterium W635]|uniref:pyridoxal-phosphate-dependent aminotransferase family protein n=1 Tax=Nioella halotolerans TaxID=2303578 RepID=UPI000E3E6DA2|nr:aminotransferase class V-fold PLP-dependent enzyme [Rhodobacteraceae bacterium W635]